LEAVIKQKDGNLLSLEMYQPIKVIGNGGFCKVYMVLNKATGGIFAMKVMDKEFIAEKNKTEQVLTELRIMEGLEHPFITSLHSAFQTVIIT
jgi:serine/threonine protein kinase